jgi:hypothetical protein
MWFIHYRRVYSIVSIIPRYVPVALFGSLAFRIFLIFFCDTLESTGKNISYFALLHYDDIIVIVVLVD